MIKVAVDTGGTFTDFLYSDGEKLRFFKLPSTPDDPSLALISGLSSLRPKVLIHGSTVATNAFLERKGSDFALFTTSGFDDLIFIGRQARPRIYDFFVDKPLPFIKEEHILGVKERITAKGDILIPLEEREIRRAMNFMEKKSLTNCAIVFLHSYKNPLHERILCENLRKAGFEVSASFEILPELREYERLSTTALNAYLNPIMRRYLQRLREAFPDCEINIQQSNGGFMDIEEASKESIHTILSGPAGGVAGALRLASKLGRNRIITFDMGGTSTDVCLIDGELPFTKEYQIQGFPIGIPLIDIHTVGAGGGSIAYVDQGGILKVGPQSAGADPGPACYGKSLYPTVTDANLFLGRLLPDFFCGGRLKLHKDRSHLAISELASKLGKSPEEVALAIVKIANIHMSQALSKVSLERGYDPKDFTLVCYGGAGGLHVCALARELNIQEIIVPKLSPVFSAFGLYTSQFIRDFSLTVLLPLNQGKDNALENLKKELERRALLFMRGKGIEEDRAIFEWSGDLRYRGQGFELTVPLEGDPVKNFKLAHLKNFGFTVDDCPVEIVTLRLRLKLESSDDIPKICTDSYIFNPFERTIITDYGLERVIVLPWDALRVGDLLHGPALIVDRYTTLLLDRDFTLEVREDGNLFLRRIHS